MAAVTVIARITRAWLTREPYTTTVVLIAAPIQQRPLALGFGCRAVNVDSTEKLAQEFTTALNADGTTVIVVPTKPQLVHLG